MPHLQKKLLTTICVSAFLCLSVKITHAQTINLDHLISMASLPQQKFEPYILKRGFYQASLQKTADSITYFYQQPKPIPKKNKPTDSTNRYLRRINSKYLFYVCYQTNSLQEFTILHEEMKLKGFYCNNQSSAADTLPLLYQYQSFTIQTSVKQTDSTVIYSFKVNKKNFPDPRDIVFADDLLVFTSHEYLSYFFGENNVKKDMYFLSGNDMAKCSVLFPNTQRQVVFLWQNEVDRCNIGNLLFGGQQKLKSILEDNTNYVAESDWVFKSGVRAGMPLYQLRILNGNDFEFYGGNSPYTGSVIPDNKGKLDFKKEDIVLGCVNCDDKKYFSTTTLNADDAIADGRIVFVLSVALNPPASPVY